MKYSKIMKERIRRVQVLFKELGYDLFDEERLEESYSTAFVHSNGLQGMFFIEKENRFLEVVYNLTFSSQLAEFVQHKMPEVFETCFEYGCYMSTFADEYAINISLFSKVYFSGLNYYSLKDTMSDFYRCSTSVKELVSLTNG